MIQATRSTLLQKFKYREEMFLSCAVLGDLRQERVLITPSTENTFIRERWIFLFLKRQIGLRGNFVAFQDQFREALKNGFIRGPWGWAIGYVSSVRLKRRPRAPIATVPVVGRNSSFAGEDIYTNGIAALFSH